MAQENRTREQELKDKLRGADKLALQFVSNLIDLEISDLRERNDDDLHDEVLKNQGGIRVLKALKKIVDNSRK